MLHTVRFYPFSTISPSISPSSIFLLLSTGPLEVAALGFSHAHAHVCGTRDLRKKGTRVRACARRTTLSRRVRHCCTERGFPACGDTHVEYTYGDQSQKIGNSTHISETSRLESRLPIPIPHRLAPFLNSPSWPEPEISRRRPTRRHFSFPQRETQLPRPYPQALPLFPAKSLPARCAPCASNPRVTKFANKLRTYAHGPAGMKLSTARMPATLAC